MDERDEGMMKRLTIILALAVILTLGGCAPRTQSSSGPESSQESSVEPSSSEVSSSSQSSSQAPPAIPTDWVTDKVTLPKVDGTGNFLTGERVVSVQHPAQWKLNYTVFTGPNDEKVAEVFPAWQLVAGAEIDWAAMGSTPPDVSFEQNGRTVYSYMEKADLISQSEGIMRTYSLYYFYTQAPDGQLYGMSFITPNGTPEEEAQFTQVFSTLTY